MENDAETFEHAGVEVRIVYDYYPENPRECRDSIATYIWADSEYAGLKDDERIDLDRFYFRESKWTSTAIAARYLTLMDNNVVAVPFRIDDYGSNGSKAYLTDVDDDRCTGFIVMSRKDAEAEWTLYPEWDPLEYIKAEFSEFQAWIEGEVYGFVIEPTEDDEEGDSCFGFYGDIDYVRKEAKEAAEHVAHERMINTEPPDVAEVLYCHR